MEMKKTKGPVGATKALTGGKKMKNAQRDRHMTAIVALATTFALLGAIPFAGVAEEAGSVTRSLPAQIDCAGGATFTVTLTVSPPSGTSSWVMEDVPPAGVTVSNVDTGNNGEYLEGQHAVKWLSLNGNAAVHTYDVAVAADTPEETTFHFEGDYRFHPSMEDRVAITGASIVECAPPCLGGPDGTFHPYDAGKTGIFTDDDLFALIDDWRLAQGDSMDDLLFAGIDSWKLSPGSYC